MIVSTEKHVRRITVPNFSTGAFR